MKNNQLAAIAFLALIAVSLSASAQKKGMQLIDSLQHEVDLSKEDTLKVMRLGMLGGAWYYVDLPKAFKPTNESLQLAQKLHWNRGIAYAENNLGMMMSDTGNTAGAREHFETSYALHVKMNNKFNMVNNLLNIGRTYSYESNFPRAMDYFFRALTIAEAIKNEAKMANVGNNIASAYSKQHNSEKTWEYGAYTVEHAAKGGDRSSMLKGLEYMGVAKTEMKDTTAAIHWFDSAIAFGRRNQLWVDLTGSLSERTLLEPDLSKRIGLELDADQLMEKVTPTSANRLPILANLGNDFLLQAQQTNNQAEKTRLLKRAEAYLDKARSMASTRNSPARLAEVLERAIQLEKYQGRYKEALADREQANAINDSLYSQENKNKIAGLETKHAVSLKDADLALSQLKLADQRKTTSGLFAGLALFAVLGTLLFWQSRSRKKANAALHIANVQLEQTNLQLATTNGQLEQANAELEEANRVKARFFGILSHDLRAPVANLLHFLTIQRRAPEAVAGAEGEPYRRQMAESAANLLNTMEGMLLWSKQQMQNFRPNPKNTPVDELFDYLQKFFSEPNSVSLLFNAGDDLTVFTDDNYLRVIMQNLTSNAIKALKGQPNATIQWTAKKEGQSTILSITDNGPGLAPEQKKTLYDAHEAENARDGFGLHIVRDLANAIRCRVEVKTEPGKGTIFYLVLPAVA